MATGTVFLNNKTQAVRLPKAVAFPPGVERVEIRVEGASRVLTPVVGTFTEWAAQYQPVPDFLLDRDQGDWDERDWGDL